MGEYVNKAESHSLAPKSKLSTLVHAGPDGQMRSAGWMPQVEPRPQGHVN